MNKGLLLTLSAIVLALVTILIAWQWFSVSPEVQEVEEVQGVQEEEESENPIKTQVPELNPAEKTNPFNESYKNPFN